LPPLPNQENKLPKISIQPPPTNTVPQLPLTRPPPLNRPPPLPSNPPQISKTPPQVPNKVPPPVPNRGPPTNRIAPPPPPIEKFVNMVQSINESDLSMSDPQIKPNESNESHSGNFMDQILQKRGNLAPTQTNTGRSVESGSVIASILARRMAWAGNDDDDSDYSEGEDPLGDWSDEDDDLIIENLENNPDQNNSETNEKKTDKKKNEKKMEIKTEDENS